MAAQHLTVLSSPSFPQHFERAFARFQGRIDRVLTQTQLGQCSHESVESRGETGEDAEYFPCGDPADVHDLLSDQPFCMKHYRAEHLRAALEAIRA
jgi:hypothetical protein